MTVQWPPADQAGVPLACVVIYSIPRTSILGASFWTVGRRHRNAGAGREHVALFPVSIGLLMWAGIYLRDERVRALIPLRRS